MSSHPPDFLAHARGDSVAVAVRDLSAGRVTGGYLTDTETGPVALTATEGIPLGHKIALTDIAAGTDVLEYGVRVGVATADIAAGNLVHVHNLRSARWQTSVA